jgi:hypothetical protein
VPDTPPESGAEESGAAGTNQPDDAPKALDVPEWVSELRRLYVEPKTRAKLRQEGAIAPQRRKLGLPGLRGSRRSGDGNGGDRAVGAHSIPSAPDQTDAWEQAQPAPAEQLPPAPAEPIFTSTAAVPPSPVPPVGPEAGRGDSAGPRSDGSHGEPQPIVEEQVGAWLNSYLEATGHAADDPDTGAGAPAEHRPSAEAAVESQAALPAAGPTTPPTTPGAASSEDGVSDEAPPASSATDAGIAVDPEPVEEEHHRSLAELAGLSAPEPGPDTWMPAVPPPPEPVAYEPPVDTVVTSIPEPGREPEPEPVAQPETIVESAAAGPAPVEPVVATDDEPVAATDDEPGPEPVAHVTPSVEPPPIQPIVEPAAVPQTVTQPTVIEPVAVDNADSQPEPEPVFVQPTVREPAAAADAPSEPAAEPDRADADAVEAPEAHPARSTAAASATVEETTPSVWTEAVDPAGAEEPPAPAGDDLAHRDGSEPHRPLPGRPSTVPAVTLSWREAESFDIGLPDVDVDDEERSIVVEPPSQLVAARRRRREHDHDHDDVDAPLPPSDAEPDLEAEPEADPVPSDDIGRASSRDGGGGRGRWVLVAVICLLIAAAAVWYFLLRDDGSGSGARSGTGTVVTASPLAPGAGPVTRLL